MAISVTTRSGKGAPLSQAEMDTNLTSLARSATDTAEGNIEIATQVEADALTDLTLAVTPGVLGGAIDANAATLGQSLTTEGTYTFPGGLILTWGRGPAVAPNNNTGTVTFHTPFPNECLEVMIGTQSDTTATNKANGMAQLKSFTKTDMVVTYDRFETSTQPIKAVYYALGK